jgi:hypothetical protein
MFYSHRRAGQPGPITRILCCTEEDYGRLSELERTVVGKPSRAWSCFGAISPPKTRSSTSAGHTAAHLPAVPASARSAPAAACRAGAHALGSLLHAPSGVRRLLQRLQQAAGGAGLDAEDGREGGLCAGDRRRYDHARALHPRGEEARRRRGNHHNDNNKKGGGGIGLGSAARPMAAAASVWTKPTRTWARCSLWPAAGAWRRRSPCVCAACGRGCPAPCTARHTRARAPRHP